jgi:alpha-glucosidase
MLAEAHRLGLRVIVDIVPSHSSDRHPWFQEALQGHHRDRYVFRPAPNGWRSLFGGPAWTQVPDGDWYLHLFDPAQPDFNWHNPEVRAEFEDVLRFWLDRGVDGFRVDVAHGMVKDLGSPDTFDHEDVHEVYRGWRKILDSYPGERMAVAEVFDTAPERVARYVRGDELHQAFNFDFLEAPWDAERLRQIIDRSIAASESVGAPPTWVLSNHDRPRLRRHRAGPGRLPRADAVVRVVAAVRVRPVARVVAADAGRLGEYDRLRADREPRIDVPAVPECAAFAPGPSGARVPAVAPVTGRRVGVRPAVRAHRGNQPEPRTGHDRAPRRRRADVGERRGRRRRTAAGRLGLVAVRHNFGEVVAVRPAAMR